MLYYVRFKTIDKNEIPKIWEENELDDYFPNLEKVVFNTQ
jgi:hypothetical protein